MHPKPTRFPQPSAFPVIAIRVVHPGVLGQPGTVLLPLAASPRSAARALFLLRLLGGDLQYLHVSSSCASCLASVFAS